MKPIRDQRVEEFEDAAMEGVKQLRAFFAYQGTDARYFQKARLATGMISAYARLRASETNRIAVEAAAGRSMTFALPPELPTPRRALKV